MATKQYKVVSEFDVAKLEDQVTNLLAAGWELGGNIVVCMNEQRSTRYTQLLVSPV